MIDGLRILESAKIALGMAAAFTAIIFGWLALTVMVMTF